MFKNKTFKFTIFIVMISLFFIGCNPSLQDQTGEITIHLDSNTKSSIIPDISVDVALYVISGTGPDGRTFGTEGNITSTGGDKTITGLYKGSWIITIIAYNDEGHALGEGTLTATIVANDNVAETVTIDEYSEDGTFNFDFSWPSDIVDTYIISTLTDLSTNVVTTLNDGSTKIVGNSWTYNAPTAPGYYTLTIALYSGSTVPANKIFGRIYTVRIVAGIETADELETTSVDLTAYGSIALTIQDTIPSSFSISVTPTDVVVAENSTTQFAVIPDKVGTTYSWYMDGVLIGSEVQNTYTTSDTLARGKYNIDVIAKSGTSYASSSAVLYLGIPDSKAPEEVEDLVATGSWSSVFLEWSNPENTDFDHVEITATSTDGSTGEVIKSTMDDTVINYTMDLTSDKEYSFVIKTIDTTGNKSEGCDAVLAMSSEGANPPSWIHGTWNGSGAEEDDPSETFTIGCEFDSDTCKANTDGITMYLQVISNTFPNLLDINWMQTLTESEEFGINMYIDNMNGDLQTATFTKLSDTVVEMEVSYNGNLQSTSTLTKDGVVTQTSPSVSFDPPAWLQGTWNGSFDDDDEIGGTNNYSITYVITDANIVVTTDDDTLEKDYMQMWYSKRGIANVSGAETATTYTITTTYSVGYTDVIVFTKVGDQNDEISVSHILEEYTDAEDVHLFN